MCKQRLEGTREGLMYDANDVLQFVFSDSEIVVKNGKVVSNTNTMSASELAEIILQFHCDQMVLILDCCFSGNTSQLTNLYDKIDAEEDRGPKSLAILCSSGVNQTSQVFVNRGISLYTSYILAALSGMADNNQDGKVSVEEIHTYAYSLVGMVSEKQERDLIGTLSGYRSNEYAAKSSVSSDDVEIQRPEFKKIVKGPNADIQFEVPNLPYEVSVNFLLNNINDIVQYHHLDPKTIRVDDFIQAGVPVDQQESRLYGRQIANVIKRKLNPKVEIFKSIIDRPKTKRNVNYRYAIQGKFWIEMAKGSDEQLVLKVNCCIVNLDTNEILTMFVLSTPPELKNTGNKTRETSVKYVEVESQDINEVAPSISTEPLEEEHVSGLQITLKRRDGKPLKETPSGYIVEKGDALVVNIDNPTDTTYCVMCLVDGLNPVIKKGENDDSRLDLISNHIDKGRYYTVGSHTEGTGFVGWVTDSHVNSKGKVVMDYNYFVVQDAPESLRSRMKVDPTKVDVPLGCIRVLIFKAEPVSVTRGSGMGEGEKDSVETTRSVFKIPSSKSTPIDMFDLNYAFKE
ncbi:MAG: hypothetical protein IJQ31_16175 [Thermoguttaceae bacterium]|nr:hypothetical protein [Thermoguttaceae bacterium]